MSSDVWADRNRAVCRRIRLLTSVGLSLTSLLAASVVCAASQSFDPGEESCTGTPEGTTCWMELVNHPRVLPLESRARPWSGCHLEWKLR